MKRFQSPLFLARLFGFRYCNGISPCREGPGVDVPLMPNFVHARRSLGLRQYSNGFHALDRNPTSFDDVCSNGGYNSETGLRQYSNGFHALDRNPTSFHDIRSSGGFNSENIEDFHQLDNSSEKRGADYMQNVEQFQQWSSTGNHNRVNLGTNTQHHSQQNPVYLSSTNATGSQQVNGNWNINSGPFQQYPSNPFTVNAVGHQPGGYQQENTGVQPSLNAHHLIVELDAVCKEWDLVRAVECMEKLSSSGVGIDLPRYLSLIDACGEAKALVEAKAVHEHLLKFVSPVSTSIFNRILDMYGKCGLMNDAYDTFNKMPERNLTTWDTMISWYAKNGLGEEAIDMFTKFKKAGLKPDGQMFFAVFDACGVVGDVSEGMLHFDSMSKIYGITPTMDHYVSIVRMFGSAGDLDGALEFIEQMPVESNVDVWESLMNISRIQGNVELGDRCGQIVEQLDPSRLTQESKMGLLPVKDSDIPKKKARKASLSEHRQHEYRAGDKSHPEQEKIYALLRGFKESMKEAGYVPQTRFVLHDIDPEEKEEAIMAHSERLAGAYFLLTSSPRTQMRIMKNLRVCGDCHNVFKILSELVGRKVVMRDQKRFHHFEGGKCSCNDYW